MTEAWDASGLSDCPECQDRHPNEGAKRLIEVAIGDVVEIRDSKHAAVSYCWSSVTSEDEDLMSQVKVVLQNSPIEFA